MNRTPFVLAVAALAACTTGTTAPPPLILLANPLSWSYGSVNVGNASAPKVFTVTNAGTTSTSAFSNGLSGANAADFTITADGCAFAGAVPASGTCQISVEFTPMSTIGTKNATLDVVALPGNASVHVSLTGVALP